MRPLPQAANSELCHHYATIASDGYAKAPSAEVTGSNSVGVPTIPLFLRQSAGLGKNLLLLFRNSLVSVGRCEQTCLRYAWREQRWEVHVSNQSGFFSFGEGRTYQLGQVKLAFKPVLGVAQGDYSVWESTSPPGCLIYVQIGLVCRCPLGWFLARTGNLH
jgi:hypothetical protein